MEKELKEVALISVVMSDTITKKLYDDCKYYLDTIDVVSEWAIEFYQKHKHIEDWEEFLNGINVLCWDDYVINETLNYYNALKKLL